jgi:hypothetical protein
MIVKLYRRLVGAENGLSMLMLTGSNRWTPVIHVDNFSSRLIGDHSDGGLDVSANAESRR